MNIKVAAFTVSEKYIDTYISDSIANFVKAQLAQLESQYDSACSKCMLKTIYMQCLSLTAISLLQSNALFSLYTSQKFITGHLHLINFLQNLK